MTSFLGFIGRHRNAYIAVLSAEIHSTWAACFTIVRFRFSSIFVKQRFVESGCYGSILLSSDLVVHFDFWLFAGVKVG